MVVGGEGARGMGGCQASVCETAAGRTGIPEPEKRRGSTFLTGKETVPCHTWGHVK